MASSQISTTTSQQQLVGEDNNKQESFSVSVGKDDWAGQVIENVVDSDKNSDTESQTDDDTNNDQHSDVNNVQQRVLEKKRLFHESRFLELKNLPDGVTEQVKMMMNTMRVKSRVNCERGETSAGSCTAPLLSNCLNCLSIVL